MIEQEQFAHRFEETVLNQIYKGKGSRGGKNGGTGEPKFPASKLILQPFFKNI